MEFVYVSILLQVYYVTAEIRNSVMVNKLAKIRPVGAHLRQSFVPLTEIPPPLGQYHTHGTEPSARRHLTNDCSKKPSGMEVRDGPKVDIFAEYYDDNGAKTVATVIFPDHIDRKHFQVTTQVPYFTLSRIDAIGYHPSTMKSEHPSECEKIYQDHLDEQYSEDSKDYSEESLEMARMPLFPSHAIAKSAEQQLEKMYSDLDI